jgi:hypothetical protein
LLTTALIIIAVVTRARRSPIAAWAALRLLVDVAISF